MTETFTLDGEGSDHRPRKDVIARYSLPPWCIEESAIPATSSDSVALLELSHPTIPLEPLLSEGVLLENRDLAWWQSMIGKGRILYQQGACKGV